MRKYYLFIFILILSGCGKTTTVLNHFGNDEKASYAVQYTKKADLIQDNQVKAMIFATYINKVDKKYDSEEINSFIIGFHKVNENEHNLLENNYNLTLNENKAVSIKKINKENNEFIKYISLKNPWANYYLVQYKSVEKEDELILNLAHSLLGSTELKFQK